MKMKMIIILIIIALVIWTVWSAYAYTVETLSYEVVENKTDYEIRKYKPYIAMQTEVDGDNTNQALNNGFRVLAGYIFGDNQGKKNVAMTAPVMEQENNSAKVAMTAPVLEQMSESGKRIITFTAPSEYTIDTLLKPNTDKIKFVEIPEKKYAAHRFSGYYTNQKIESKKKYLLDLLIKDNIKILGEPMFAGYNGPGTMPFLMRNEILIEIE